MHSRQLRLALMLDPKFLYLRGFKVGNSLNVTSLIRHVGGIFGGPRSRISVALSCLSWGCFCSRDLVSNAWRYATDSMDCITYLKDQNVALSWLVQEDFCKRMQHSSCYLFCCSLPQNLDNCTDCSGCSSELLLCHGETHGLPARSHILQFLPQQAKG